MEKDGGVEGRLTSRDGRAIPVIYNDRRESNRTQSDSRRPYRCLVEIHPEPFSSRSLSLTATGNTFFDSRLILPDSLINSTLSATPVKQDDRVNIVLTITPSVYFINPTSIAKPHALESLAIDALQ